MVFKNFLVLNRVMGRRKVPWHIPIGIRVKYPWGAVVIFQIFVVAKTPKSISDRQKSISKGDKKINFWGVKLSKNVISKGKWNGPKQANVRVRIISWGYTWTNSSVSQWNFSLFKLSWNTELPRLEQLHTVEFTWWNTRNTRYTSVVVWLNLLCTACGFWD